MHHDMKSWCIVSNSVKHAIKPPSILTNGKGFCNVWKAGNLQEDCFAYRGDYCHVLILMDCKECSFYKPKGRAAKTV